jgi:phosphoribosylaminoimidazole carboxylase (NCAIR synthetase)
MLKRWKLVYIILYALGANLNQDLFLTLATPTAEIKQIICINKRGDYLSSEAVFTAIRDSRTLLCGKQIRISPFEKCQKADNAPNLIAPWRVILKRETHAYDSHGARIKLCS